MLDSGSLDWLGELAKLVMVAIRGRLMGYLTANPGCHFRALMAALEMSNGQITHHLKILEDEDRIWRRADGRLVRFYPFTSNLHHGILDEDLPLPPLSPDLTVCRGRFCGC